MLSKRLAARESGEAGARERRRGEGRLVWVKAKCAEAGEGVMTRRLQRDMDNEMMGQS